MAFVGVPRSGGPARSSSRGAADHVAGTLPAVSRFLSLAGAARTAAIRCRPAVERTRSRTAERAPTERPPHAGGPNGSARTVRRAFVCARHGRERRTSSRVFQRLKSAFIFFFFFVLFPPSETRPVRRPRPLTRGWYFFFNSKLIRARPTRRRRSPR